MVASVAISHRRKPLAIAVEIEDLELLGNMRGNGAASCVTLSYDNSV
jgi:hypothetical protein